MQAAKAVDCIAGNYYNDVDEDLHRVETYLHSAYHAVKAELQTMVEL